MTQNPLISPNAGSASLPFRCFLQFGYPGLRFVRYQSSPWLVLAIASLKLLFASGEERIREQVRYFRAIAQIDFVGLYGLLNDCLW